MAIFKSSEITKILPQARLGILELKLTLNKATNDLLNIELEKVQKTILENLKNEKEHSVISQTRKAYKACGKEPSRYRPSAEALHRRIRKGNKLYRINEAVDTINLLSLKSGYSIGAFDQHNIIGDITLDIGSNEPYQAIGRGLLNIEHMPGLKDEKGFFGTPTSDSERTKIHIETTQMLVVYYDFYSNPMLKDALQEASDLFKAICQAETTEMVIF